MGGIIGILLALAGAVTLLSMALGGGYGCGALGAGSR